MAKDSEGDPAAEPDYAGVGPDSPGPPGAPRWVKVSAIVALIVVLLFVVVVLISGGQHGPGRHMPQPGVGELRPHEP